MGLARAGLIAVNKRKRWSKEPNTLLCPFAQRDGLDELLPCPKWREGAVWNIEYRVSDGARVSKQTFHATYLALLTMIVGNSNCALIRNSNLSTV